MSVLRRKINGPSLTSVTESKVRFSEIDSMMIVWHGNYAKYFEDGREAFGREYEGLSYTDIYQSGYTAPIVEMNLEYLRPLKFGDSAIVETRYVDSPAAKMYFEYVIKRKEDGQVAVRGYTVQAFLDGDGQLCLTTPDFFLNWKKRWLK